MRSQKKQSVTSRARPTTEDSAACSVYWKAQNQPWRTEPEISLERQTELKRLCLIVSDSKRGIHPFEKMKLSRADIEWLQAMYFAGSDFTKQRIMGTVNLDPEVTFLICNIRKSLTCNISLAGSPLDSEITEVFPNHETCG